MAVLAIAGTIGQIRDENIDELTRYVIQVGNRIFRCPEEPIREGSAEA
jgi:hypothetical protein